jgi:excisionase family DNA binding protein
VSQLEDLLDIKQAARFLGVSETSLRRWTNSGLLAHMRVGRKRERRFRRADLVAFMEQQPAGPGEEAADGARRHTTIGGIPVPYGAHWSAFYGDEAGRIKLAAGFLADGLRPGSVCFLVTSPESRPAVLARLGGRASLESEIEQGRLVPSQYPGTPTEQYDYWETHFLKAVTGGASSLRVVGDIGSFLDAGMSLDDVMEYERGYERLMARRFPVVTLCMYDVRRFDSVAVMRALREHRDTFRYPAERLLA